MVNTHIKDSLLRELILNFYKGNHNFTLKDEDIEKIDWDWQASFLTATFDNKLMKQYPVSSQYSKLFLKKLIQYLEPKQEIHDEIYAQLCTVMKDSHHDGFCYRHYIIGEDLNKVITMKETRNMVVNGTTGLKTWEAALMLSDWALSNKDMFVNKNVLELGSGTGFAGITIGKMCNVKSLLLSDCHDDVLTTMKCNMDINFSNFTKNESNNITLYKKETKSIGAMMLDWNDVDDLSVTIRPDIIIGADIVYDPTILASLCKVLYTFSRINENLEIYIASVIRNEETFRMFLKTLGFRTSDAMNYKWNEVNIRKSVYVDWNESIQKCLLRIKLI